MTHKPRADSRAAAQPCPEQEGLSFAEVHRRALSGSILLTGKAIVLQGVALVGTVIVARILGPRDIGMVAFGMTLLTFLGYVGGGQALGGAFIRAPRDPDRHQLETLLGLQIAVLLPLSALAIAAALPFGDNDRWWNRVAKAVA